MDARTLSIIAAVIIVAAIVATTIIAWHHKPSGAVTTTATSGTASATGKPSPTAQTTQTQATAVGTSTTTITTTTTTATGAATGTPTSTSGGAATTTAAGTATATQPPAGKCSKSIELVVLTRHPADIQEKAREMFLKSDIAKRYCIKDIRFIAVPAGFWPTYIEKQSIDVAWGGGPTLFDNLYLKGLLRPLQSKLALDAASQVPDRFAGVSMKRIGKDGKIYWVAAAIASFGFTVNRDVAKQLGFNVSRLKSWRDLASDDLGLILVKYGVPALAIANPLQSTSNTRIYEIILQAYGWKEGWRVLTLMAANARIEEGSAIVRDDVINGEVMVGITIDFYGYTAERLNPACKYVLPRGETIVNGDPIAVVKSTKNPEAAEAFVAWALTEGQKIWLDPNINRLPANPKVFETPEGQKRPDLERAFYEAMRSKVIRFNDTLALETEYAMQLYFVATLIDQHTLLQKAWTRLLKAYYIDHSIDEATFNALREKLTDLVNYKDPVTGKEVVFTLQDAIRVNKILQKNINLKEAYMNAWREAAKQKYEEVLKALGG
ncbi:ABC transporter substrate-binding protein [Pyrodictium occultum]|uniref:ABC transporter substrate-binding protein n=1 Tax=Pyrodictium occultum TaxID=2309 RepID=UPI000ABD48FE|nr:ABC transporter substrate-binding protein [Pyrodictium occultum]